MNNFMEEVQMTNFVSGLCLILGLSLLSLIFNIMVTAFSLVKYEKIDGMTEWPDKAYKDVLLRTMLLDSVIIGALLGVIIIKGGF